jgi:hypothetical protein
METISGKVDYLANPIKIITPTPKFLSWRNYKNSLFQCYTAVFMTQNHAKRHFLA